LLFDFSKNYARAGKCARKSNTIHNVLQ